jgi:spore germination cell wall hydrolase CwlJ-like protein
MKAFLVGCLSLTVMPVEAPIEIAPPYEEEVYCLAINVYHEARGEDYLAQLAVADVTMNRVESEKFSNSVCEVITEAQTVQLVLRWRE